MSGPPFRIPVDAPLHAFEWLRPRGNTEFRVTQKFDHVNLDISRAIHGGVDMGSGQLPGRKVYAIDDGTVLDAGYLLGPWSQASSAWPPAPNYGGLMLAIRMGDDYIWAPAHLQRTLVARGQKVRRGQQVGNVGDSGAAQEFGTHLHNDLYRRLREGESSGPLAAISYAGSRWGKVDLWPLLEQNWTGVPDTATTSPQEDDDMTWGQYALPLSLSALTVKAGTIPYAGPGREFGEHSPGFAFVGGERLVTALVVILPDNAGQWYACSRGDGPGIFWVAKSGVATITVIASTSVDCAAEVAAAEQRTADSFRARIEGIKSDVAAFAASIANR